SRIIIVNQFALVQTKDFEGESDHIGVENDTFIEQALDEADIILIAWGAANPYKKRQEAIHVKILEHKGKKIFKTKAHPSRGTYKDFIERIPSSTDFSSVEASADAKGKERYFN
ncbi:MAG: DUF1643 domain-containing protein, partial [Desulfopila sp.]|nr:DUF1643 domain-containing protein [Desulfopila sp.]